MTDWGGVNGCTLYMILQYSETDDLDYCNLLSPNIASGQC